MLLLHQTLPSRPMVSTQLNEERTKGTWLGPRRGKKARRQPSLALRDAPTVMWREFIVHFKLKTATLYD